MKNGYAMVRRLKLTPFELRVAIEALNAKRLKQKANGIDNRATSNLILHLLDVLEVYRAVISPFCIRTLVAQSKAGDVFARLY